MAVEKLELDLGVGGVTWWGFSPWTSITGPRALLIGAGGPRHLIKSVAEGEEEGERVFYILEQNIQVYCRQVSPVPSNSTFQIDQCSDSLGDSPE